MSKLIDKYIAGKRNGRRLNRRELELMTYEIRDFLITNISATGGHLASNLGVVELTVALHRVFNVDKDRIVWDVGHQIYVHKILTGRADDFSTLRQLGGMSGFPNTDEDPSDVYNSGHASTSISAAMGLAEARDMRGEDHHVIAVIGDSALAGGLAYEGLNNAGKRQTRMIVILNDNETSLSENTGSVASYLSKLRVSPTYQSAKHVLKERMARIPRVGESMVQGADRMRNLMRYAVVPGTLFEELGFKYYGPIDGHNLGDMIELLKEAKQLEGPVLIHTVTKKGKGYVNAEKNPDRFHGPDPFDPATGSFIKEVGTSWSGIAGETMMALAEHDPYVVCISASMTEGVGLTNFAKSYFKHFFDVGISEEHAVVFAAGLALGGMKPFVFISSTFLQRAYDQIISDICMQKLPVVFMIDGAGNVGGDGEKHHGVFDLSFLGHMPGLVLMAPKDAEELKAMAVYAMTLGGPAAIRYPRGEVPVLDISESAETEILELGKSERLKGKDDTKVELFALGKMVAIAIDAASILEKEGVNVGVVNARFAAPVDKEYIVGAARRGAMIVTLEDNAIKGGFGERAASVLAEEGICASLHCVGWPDEFVGHGDVDELMSGYKLDSAGVAARILEYLGERTD